MPITEAQAQAILLEAAGGDSQTVVLISSVMRLLPQVDNAVARALAHAHPDTAHVRVTDAMWAEEVSGVLGLLVAVFKAKARRHGAELTVKEPPIERVDALIAGLARVAKESNGL